jgi:hypothetical protein
MWERRRLEIKRDVRGDGREEAESFVELEDLVIGEPISRWPDLTMILNMNGKFMDNPPKKPGEKK